MSELYLNGLFYFEAGQGEPILFLHGGFDTCINYTRFIEELAKNFRVIAVDRRGHGKSLDTDALFDYEIMAEELHDFTCHLGLNSFHIVGSSDGANIGFHMANLYPEKVQRLIAISGNYKNLSTMSADWLELIQLLSVDLIQKHMPEILQQYAQLNPNPAPNTFVAKTKQLWNKEYVITAEKLKAIQAPTLIVGGDKDFVLPEQMQEMHQLIPNSSLLILPQSDHFVFLDSSGSAEAPSAIQKCITFLLDK